VTDEWHIRIEQRYLNNEAGAGARAKEQELAGEKGAARRFLERVFDPRTEERSWRRGAEGEEKAAAELAKLGAGWAVIHDLTIGRKGANLDHLVIGPAGVFALNTKNLTGKLTVYEHAILQNGHKTAFVPAALREVRTVQKRLSAVAGRDVRAWSVLVVMGCEVEVRKPPANLTLLGARSVSRGSSSCRAVRSPPERCSSSNVSHVPPTRGCPPRTPSSRGQDGPPERSRHPSPRTHRPRGPATSGRSRSDAGSATTRIGSTPTVRTAFASATSRWQPARSCSRWRTPPERSPNSFGRATGKSASPQPASGRPEAPDPTTPGGQLRSTRRRPQLVCATVSYSAHDEGRPMPSSTSFRLSDRAKERLQQRADREGTSSTALLERLILEGVATLDHPGIVYRGSATDRRAAIAGGPDVWEVVARLRELTGAEEERIELLAEESELHPRQIRLALEFAARHPEEVDRRLALHEEAIRESRQAAEQRQAYLA
jgi:hypothetical protein